MSYRGDGMLMCEVGAECFASGFVTSKSEKVKSSYPTYQDLAAWPIVYAHLDILLEARIVT